MRDVVSRLEAETRLGILSRRRRRRSDIGVMPTIKLCTVAEASVVTGMSVRTVERHIAAGKLETARTEDGRVRVRLEVPDDVEVAASDDPGGSAASTALAVSESMRGVLAALERTSTRSDRSRSRWTATAVVAIAVAAAGVAVSVIAVPWSIRSDRQLSDMQTRVNDLEAVLAESRQRVAVLEAEAEASAKVSDMTAERLRQSDRHVGQLESQLTRLTRDRDRLEEDLADLRTAVLLESDPLTAMSDPGLWTAD